MQNQSDGDAWNANEALRSEYDLSFKALSAAEALDARAKPQRRHDQWSRGPPPAGADGTVADAPVAVRRGRRAVKRSAKSAIPSFIFGENQAEEKAVTDGEEENESYVDDTWVVVDAEDARGQVRSRDGGQGTPIAVPISVEQTAQRHVARQQARHRYSIAAADAAAQAQ